MLEDDKIYHQRRCERERALSVAAKSPLVESLHRRLAELHADAAATSAQQAGDSRSG